MTSTAIGMESFGKTLDEVRAGDNAAVLLRGVRRDEVRRGQVLVVPGSVTPHARFTARLHALTAAEGGRHTPFASDYAPQFYFRTTDVAGSLDLGEVDLVHPGDTVDVTVELGKPVPMEVGPRLRRPRGQPHRRRRRGDHTAGLKIPVRRPATP